MGKLARTNTVAFPANEGRRVVLVRTRISSHGLDPHADAVARAFGADTAYRQIIKGYRAVDRGRCRYAPARVPKMGRLAVAGRPNKDRGYTLNFGRVRQALRLTPEMEAGVVDRIWAVVDLWDAAGGAVLEAAA